MKPDRYDGRTGDKERERNMSVWRGGDVWDKVETINVPIIVRKTLE